MNAAFCKDKRPPSRRGSGLSSGPLKSTVDPPLNWSAINICDLLALKSFGCPCAASSLQLLLTENPHLFKARVFNLRR